MGQPLNRRDALTLGALALLAGCGQGEAKVSAGPLFPVPPPSPGVSDTVARIAAGTPSHKIALTVDDGYDAGTVKAYVELAVKTGISLTFNPIAKLAKNWEPHAQALRPLIERGQVQIGNHTYRHLDLTVLSDQLVLSEVERNDAWIVKTFGVTSRPYLRPPLGHHDKRVDDLAASVGFTKVLMWQGSFEDATLVSPQALLAAARTALLPGSIILGHANHPTVSHLFGQLQELITQRRLDPVTVDELLGTSRRQG